MHHIHRTKAYVIKSLPHSEADKVLFLLTEEFGLVRAVAQGVRKIESKLRQSIQDYSLSNVALVLGKAGWRLTNATLINNFYTDFSNEELKQAIIRIFDLINRLVVGEDREDNLFEIVDEAVNFIASSHHRIIASEDDVRNFELILLIKILDRLGHFDSSEFKEFIKGEFSVELFSKLDQKKATLKVNEAIKHSGL